jgi:azurin
MNVRSFAVIAVSLAVTSLASPLAARQGAAPAAQPRLVTLTVNDPVGEKMNYSLATITAKPGEKLKIRLVSLAQTPKIVMAHNWVLLKAGSSAKAFSDAAANARATDFIPPALKGQILAELPLAGPGEKFEVVITAPKVPGTYPYLCTFAGHYAAGMAGNLIVK